MTGKPDFHTVFINYPGNCQNVKDSMQQPQEESGQHKWLDTLTRQMIDY